MANSNAENLLEPETLHFMHRTVFILFINLAMVIMIVTILYLAVSHLFFVTEGKIFKTDFERRVADALAYIVLQILNIFFTFYVVLNWFDEYYIIRPNEIILRTGIIQKRQTSYAIETIQSISVFQGIFGQLFNFGSVRLYNPVLAEEVMLHHVANPYRVAQIIKELHPNPDVIQFLPKRRIG